MDIHERLERLVELWCDRRAYAALREILRGWPLTTGLTDDWAGLGDALKGVRAHASRELTVEETNEVETLIAEVDGIVFRK